jgi:hypothetical protein
MRRAAALALELWALSALSACSHDVVLPDETVPGAACGNGVTEAEEECDVASPGCVDCQVEPGWTCTSTTCTQTCGDGGTSCTSSGRKGACDVTGFWAVRETTYLRDKVFNAIQVSSNWYLYEIAQTGDTFTLTASLDCGVHVTGSATIDYPAATKQALIWQNAQDGSDPSRGPRSGTSSAASGGCEVTMGPWYFVRGVTTDYLPKSFGAAPPLSALPALPTVSDPVGGDVFPSGATDPTTNGIPGFGTLVSGLAPGERYSAQRSTTSFAGGTHVAASAMTIVVGGTFDVDENVLRVTECGQTCSLLTTLAVPATDIPPHSTWQFLGTALGSASVSPVVVAKPRTDVTKDLETCANVVAILPHDATVPTSP